MMHFTAKRFIFRTLAGKDESRTACELLAQGTGLSNARIKDAMQKGAVGLLRRGTAEKRLRRASAIVRAGDALAIY